LYDDLQSARSREIVLASQAEQTPSRARWPADPLPAREVPLCPNHVGSRQGNLDVAHTALVAYERPAGAFLNRDLIRVDRPSDPTLIALYGRIDHLGQDLC
jgi:hypothetical protein